MLRTKDVYTVLIGYRMLEVSVLFSESSTDNLHRMLRRVTLSSARLSVAGSVVAPVQFGPVPVLLFQPPTQPYVHEPILHCASGSVFAFQPQRVMLKRVRLAGQPFKIHKHSAVIRFMFFHPRDVKYFSPVQLTSAHGRIGHIKEPLGTHGYMKVNDTVYLNLFKRVYAR